MLTRNLLVALWCTEQGDGAVICATAYISLVSRHHQGPSSPDQCLSTVVLRYRDAKISLYLSQIAVFTAYLLPGLMYAVFKAIKKSSQ